MTVSSKISPSFRGDLCDAGCVAWGGDTLVSDATLARSRPFVLRYYERRRDVLAAVPTDAAPTRLYEQVALAALPDFAHWVAVVATAPGDSFSHCTEDHHHSFAACRFLFDSELDLEGACAEVLASSTSVVWNDDDEGPHGIVSLLVVEDAPVGVVILARQHGAAPWNDDDLGAIHDVVTALGVDVERLRLRYASRQALRASQRVASQLHQVISASLTVGTLSNESQVAQSLARSARSVFDGERALVSLGDATHRVVATIDRGRAPHLINAIDNTGEYPMGREDTRETWVDNGWLCAPVRDSQRRARGVVATQRTSSTFSDEDHELAMLLGQLAATSLEALDLTRTILDNETRLRILVDAAPVGIVESNPDGQVRWWNRSASRLLRWPDFNPGALEQAPWPATFESALSELWHDLLSGGLRDTCEFTADLGGRERLLAVSAAVLPGGGGEPSVLTLLDDITDQRELREEVRHAHRMELRGQVASSVAHDFNNLMTLILGYTELLSRTVAGDRKAEGLVIDIQSTSTRAATLTAQLQSIGRTSQPAPVQLDIGAALGALAEVLERIMSSKNTIVWSLAESTPPVTIDADLFEQMILNLSINARDAMTNGGTLHLSTAVEDIASDDQRVTNLVPGTYVTLRIADTGTGMDGTTLARCFDPLFTTKGPFKGTGLGLASARRLVEESGGAITCTSAPGAGTTFTIYLPAVVTNPLTTDSLVADADDAAPVPTPRPPREQMTGTILLCEDDAGLRRLAVQVLRRNGFEVVEAESAEVALAVRTALAQPLDMLVSDVVLPEMDGTELARRLQHDQADLLVVLMSGTAEPGVIDALHEGTAAFLAKPFKPSELVDEVTALFTQHTRASN